MILSIGRYDLSPERLSWTIVNHLSHLPITRIQIEDSMGNPSAEPFITEFTDDEKFTYIMELAILFVEQTDKAKPRYLTVYENLVPFALPAIRPQDFFDTGRFAEIIRLIIYTAI